MLAATLVLVAIVALIVTLSSRDAFDAHVMLFSVYAIPASVILLITAWRGGPAGRAAHAPTRLCAGVIAGTVAVGMVGVHSCAHATYLDVGPITLVPIYGRACGNTQRAVPFWPVTLVRRLAE